MNTFMEGTRLIVHHVLGCRTKLLVPLNDLIDSLQEVLLCHSFPSCTNCVHACLCTHTPDIGTWTTSYLHQSSSFVLRQPQTWRNGHHLSADYFHHVSLCHKNSTHDITILAFTICFPTPLNLITNNQTKDDPSLLIIQTLTNRYYPSSI